MTRRVSLTNRIFLVTIILVSTAIIVLGIFLTASFKDNYLDSIGISLKSQAYLVAGGIQDDIKAGDAASITRKFREFGSRGVDRLTAIDRYGIVLGDSVGDVGRMGNHRNRPEFVDALNGRVGIRVRRSPTLRVNMIYVAVPVGDGGNVVGAVRSAKPLDEINRLVRRVYITLLISVVVILTLIVAMGYPLSLRITQPLRDLKQAAMKLAMGDFAVRVRASGDDEIASLAQSFNHMGDTVAKSIRQLENEKQRIETILDNLAEGVIVTDRSGAIVSVNRASERLFDIKAHDAVGKSVISALINHDIEVGVLRSLAYNEAAENEIVVSRPEPRVLRVYSVPLQDAKGNVAGSLIVFQDISRLKQLQQIRQDFVANVSHELRTPIASVKAMAETLIAGAMDDATVSRKFLETINSEADRLARLVDDLLQLSKIESRASLMQIEEVNLAELVGRTCVQLSSKAEQMGITLRNMVDTGVGIMADRDRMYQIFVNLMDNAITHSGGRNVWVDAHADGNSVSISVEDDGIGIPNGETSRIFERFYRVDKARSRQLGGTGLGLAIVKHIVEAHGGSISVSSSEGHGTRFGISLPKTKPV